MEVRLLTRNAKKPKKSLTSATWQKNNVQLGRRKPSEKSRSCWQSKKKAEKDEEFQKQWESWSEEQREEWLRQEAERIARCEKAKEEREEFRKRITNIRGIALRIPLLMYGGADAGDTKENITVDNFTAKLRKNRGQSSCQRVLQKRTSTKSGSASMQPASKRQARNIEPWHAKPTLCT